MVSYDPKCCKEIKLTDKNDNKTRKQVSRIFFEKIRQIETSGKRLCQTNSQNHDEFEKTNELREREAYWFRRNVRS